MKNNNQNRKVILVNGGSSKWYEQAIFIVRSPAPNVPTNLAKEAERIIYEHMTKKQMFKDSTAYPKPSAPKTAKPAATRIKSNAHNSAETLLSIGIVICCILIGIILYAIFK